MTVEIPGKTQRTDWTLVTLTTQPEVVRKVIDRETRNWGIGLIALGGLQLTGTLVDLDRVWGVTLVLIGAASFYFRSAAMLAVYAVTMGWVAVINMLDGELPWVAFALLQAYLANRTLRQFKMLRSAAVRLGIGLGVGPADRAAAVFPWAGAALAAISAIGLPALIVGLGIWSAVTEHEPNPEIIGTAILALAHEAAVGMALAVSALLARYRHGAVSIFAVLVAGLLLAGVVALAVLG